LRCIVAGKADLRALSRQRLPGLSGSSIQSGSSDESASKELNTTGTYHLNTTDFATSKKVDVGTTPALLEKVQSEEVKTEMKRAKEAKEANRCEGSEVQQKAIAEANLLQKESREERKKDEEHRLLLQLNTEQRGSLDADAKANLVDFYYEEEERVAVWWEVEKKREEREREETRETAEGARQRWKMANKANTPGHCEHGRRGWEGRHCKDCRA
jgi:hypothetical protein